MRTPDAFAAERETWRNVRGIRPSGIMVIGRIRADMSWLHARIGASLPVVHSPRGNRRAPNARVREPAPEAVLRPTVYRPASARAGFTPAPPSVPPEGS